MARTTVFLSIAAVVLTLFAVALWPARSDESEPVTFQAAGSGVLDGLKFEGMFGPADGSSDRADVLYFDEGHFWSKNCVPCGFLPGPYQATRTDEGIRFEGVMTSPERGNFRYTGLVKDGKVTARVHWRKERWYWTIDKDFRFRGARAEGSAAVSAKGATLVALAAKPDPSECRL